MGRSASSSLMRAMLAFGAFLVGLRSSRDGILVGLGALVLHVTERSRGRQKKRTSFGVRSEVQERCVGLQFELSAAHGRIQHLTEDLAAAPGKAVRLDDELRAATKRIDQLASELSEVRGSGQTRGASERERIYARLGLTPSVPDAFLPHIRRAVLLSLHPDRHPDHRKGAANKRFIEAMGVLDQIERERGRAPRKR